MADQNYAAALIVQLQIRVPGIENIGVGRVEIERAAALPRPPKPGYGHLAINRGVESALGGESRRLTLNDAGFGLARRQISVVRRLGGYGRINVEAIDFGASRPRLS